MGLGQLQKLFAENGDKILNGKWEMENGKWMEGF